MIPCLLNTAKLSSLHRYTESLLLHTIDREKKTLSATYLSLSSLYIHILCSTSTLSRKKQIRTIQELLHCECMLTEPTNAELWRVDRHVPAAPRNNLCEVLSTPKDSVAHASVTC